MCFVIASEELKIVAEIIAMRITIVVYFLPDAGNHASSAVSTK
jgi:hypothetical protein